MTATYPVGRSCLEALQGFSYRHRDGAQLADAGDPFTNAADRSKCTRTMCGGTWNAQPGSNCPGKARAMQWRHPLMFLPASGRVSGRLGRKPTLTMTCALRVT